MKKEEILKAAQNEKKDEGRKYVNDFALAAAGAFAFIVISLMILYKHVTNESYGELLSLFIGMVGAFCYGKFVLTSKKYWLFGAAILLSGSAIVFMDMSEL
ncbi:hypothetical protein CIL05_06140 [Virgibacillus profundi]|uniref:Uncharacterized protein n=1 Tax=Virgibacillus profundi TaxID=2024555 RepID=A0A2A2IH35_9BACI|nr:DUF6442 family protein [Virgibacillus profundi]PAV30678.1 hypothetical protein CIL05_06140 [Virgibacillus profundi]PXY54850.1 hypothetical protein CIT14_06225 [Virgibacillus profundi]